MGHVYGVADCTCNAVVMGFDPPVIHKITNRKWKATSGHERDFVEHSRFVTIEKVLVGTTCKGMPVRRGGSIPLRET